MCLPLAHRDRPRREICKITISLSPIPLCVILSLCEWWRSNWCSLLVLSCSRLHVSSCDLCISFLLCFLRLILVWQHQFFSQCLLTVSCWSLWERSGFFIHGPEFECFTSVQDAVRSRCSDCRPQDASEAGWEPQDASEAGWDGHCWKWLWNGEKDHWRNQGHQLCQASGICLIFTKT